MRSLTYALAAASTMAVSLAWLSCSRDPASVADRTGTLSLKVVFAGRDSPSRPWSSPETLPVDSLSVSVWGAGMDTMKLVVPVVNRVASGTMEGIPAGSHREVEAVAWSAAPFIQLYRGTDTVAIEAGKVSQAYLTMHRLQDGPGARLRVIPDTTQVGLPVMADASESFNPYGSDSVLAFRFTLNGEEIGGWSAANHDTFPAPPRGSWLVGVVVRDDEGEVDSTECVLCVKNTAPGEPSSPSPAPGDTVWTLIPTVFWEAEDPDDDVMTFTVWYGSDSTAVAARIPPASALSVQSDSASLTGVQPDTAYYWKVVASDGEDATEGDLWHFMTADAAFTLEPDSLRFPCGVDELPVFLAALGRFELPWSATPDVPWLAVIPASGIVGGTPSTVHVAVTSRSGLAPGLHDGVVEFQAGGFTVPVYAQLEVSPGLGSAMPESIHLAAPAFTDTILIVNDGCGDLNWAASSGVQWLACLPSGGAVPGGSTGQVAVVGDTTRLSTGEHAAVLNLEIMGTVYPITVTLTIGPERCLDVTPDSLQIDEGSPSAACTLWNCGAQAIDWTSSTADTWVEVVPDGGTLDVLESQAVTINVDVAELPSGLATSSVWFHGAGQPVPLTLMVMVPGLPVLDVSPDELYLPADHDTAEAVVANSGTGILSWAVTAIPAWTTASPSSGMLRQGEAVLLRLPVDRMGLELGVQAGELAIASNGGSKAVGINLDVGAEGCADPIFADRFASGPEGWIPDPVGTWGVQDGRYVVQEIPQGTLALSQHLVQYLGATRAQVDVRTGAAPDATGAVSLRCEMGFTVSIEGTSADALTAVLDDEGTVRLQARAVSNGQWFSFGDAGGGLHFPDGWNSLAVVFSSTHVVGMLNGETAVQYQFPTPLRMPPLGAVMLMGSGEGIISFDRVFVCPE